jgi:DNA polymerase V
VLALVDVNNMYVSCERVFRPTLVERPVVVLSHNDGVCIARSNEAKDLGVEMAQPWFQVRHLQRQAGLVALSANFELYGDMSNRMMTLAAGYAPRQEIYSIDECFLDFTGVRGNLSSLGRALRAQVLQWTGLPTSVGFANTKTLAKLANHVAKTAERKPGSYPRELAQVCNFAELPAARLEAVMRATEVGAVWGIGRKTSARLQEGGVRSVHDVLHADPVVLRRQFSVVLERTLRELRGEPCLGVDDAPGANQQIMCSRSFGEPVTSLASLVESVSGFASRVAQKLRSQRSVAGAVQVFLSTSPFRKQERQHSPSATLVLKPPTGDTRLLAAALARGDVQARLSLCEGRRGAGRPAAASARGRHARPIRRGDAAACGAARPHTADDCDGHAQPALRPRRGRRGERRAPGAAVRSGRAAGAALAALHHAAR